VSLGQQHFLRKAASNTGLLSYMSMEEGFSDLGTRGVFSEGLLLARLSISPSWGEKEGPRGRGE
jgi:hypothetical protein